MNHSSVDGFFDKGAFVLDESVVKLYQWKEVFVRSALGIYANPGQTFASSEQADIVVWGF